MPELRVDAVELAYGAEEARVQALDGVSVAPSPGCLTLLAGPSGSGKTSLLSVMGALVRPDAGRVWIDGCEVGSLAEQARARFRLEKIGFVFQAFRLLKALSAEENVALPLVLLGQKESPARACARRVLDRLGLEGRYAAMPAHLSGGEKQRVAIARALASDPPIVLADEPTASLDSANGAIVAGWLREIAEREGRIVVVVSHDERLIPVAHQTVRLRDGRIVKDSE